MLNKTELIGYLGRDVELRYTAAGLAVAKVALGTNEKWTDKNTGEKRENTEWHNLVAFGNVPTDQKPVTRLGCNPRQPTLLHRCRSVIQVEVGGPDQSHELNRRRGLGSCRQGLGLVGFFPGEPFAFASEVTVGRGLDVDRPAQPQPLDDACGR